MKTSLHVYENQFYLVEIYIGDNGKIEKCEIEGRDGSISEIVSEQISIFGKQVTVIDLIRLLLQQFDL